MLSYIYADTNLYQGFFWNLIEPKLSPNRTHTALSVGDEITLDGRTYICADFGWIKPENAEIESNSNGVVFSVTEKVGA